jgi:hypothetical protein
MRRIGSKLLGDGAGAAHRPGVRAGERDEALVHELGLFDARAWPAKGSFQRRSIALAA